jgi:hypothetical protein
MNSREKAHKINDVRRNRSFLLWFVLHSAFSIVHFPTPSLEKIRD